MTNARPRSVGIVGAGFTGTMLAVHLIELSRVPLRVILFDRTATFGNGTAYATPNAKHLLNVRVANMSAYGLARHWRSIPVYEALLLQDGVTLPHGRPVTPAPSAPELPGEVPP